jgi:glycosyltransferase involved in cell wall biosynthesis
VIAPFAVDVVSARRRMAHLVPSMGSPLLGNIGSFQEARNHFALAQAFRVVLDRYRSAHLVVMGRTTGPDCAASAARFRREVSRLGMAANVTVAGDVSEARSLLPALDAFIGASSLEGSSNALAEAMVAGVATATTPVADAAELLGRGGVIAHGYSPDAIAESALEVLSAPLEWKGRARLRGDELMLQRSPVAVGSMWLRVLEAAAGYATGDKTKSPREARRRREVST